MLSIFHVQAFWSALHSLCVFLCYCYSYHSSLARGVLAGVAQYNWASAPTYRSLTQSSYSFQWYSISIGSTSCEGYLICTQGVYGRTRLPVSGSDQKRRSVRVSGSPLGGGAGADIVCYTMLCHHCWHLSASSLGRIRPDLETAALCTRSAGTLGQRSPHRGPHRVVSQPIMRGSHPRPRQTQARRRRGDGRKGTTRSGGSRRPPGAARRTRRA